LFVDDLDNAVAVFLQLINDLFLVLLDTFGHCWRVLGLVLQGIQYFNLGPEIANDIFVSRGAKISFGIGKLILW
jgi:hypothetical protein